MFAACVAIAPLVSCASAEAQEQPAAGEQDWAAYTQSVIAAMTGTGPAARLENRRLRLVFTPDAYSLTDKRTGTTTTGRAVRQISGNMVPYNPVVTTDTLVLMQPASTTPLMALSLTACSATRITFRYVAPQKLAGRELSFELLPTD
jgi:hypothetical protein